MDFFCSRDPEVLLCGPAGTGKSRCALEKAHFLAEKYPGSRGLIARQTRRSLTTTALVTLETEVIPVGHPALFTGTREHRQGYRYPNGSTIDIVGMDDPQKAMSSQYDWIYIQEATECKEEAVEMLTTRLRNGKMPYQQLMMDCNPDSPNHWLKRRCDSGKTRMIFSTHKDNPTLWDGRDWTESGLRYIERLQALTGTRLQRLFYGQWASPEGARFPYLDPSEHLFDRHSLFPKGIPHTYKRFISLDWGMAAPYCALWHAVDHDGNIFTYREDYAANLTSSQQAERILAMSDNVEFHAVWADPSIWNSPQRMHWGTTQNAPSIAETYKSVWAGDPRFRNLAPGYNKSRVSALNVLDNYLSRNNGHPNWYIERKCENLWRELQDAAYAKNQVTGQLQEDLDPSCDDHAITAAYYGLCSWRGVPKESVKYEDARLFRLKQREKELEDGQRKLRI